MSASVSRRWTTGLAAANTPPNTTTSPSGTSSAAHGTRAAGRRILNPGRRTAVLEELRQRVATAVTSIGGNVSARGNARSAVAPYRTNFGGRRPASSPGEPATASVPAASARASRPPGGEHLTGEVVGERRHFRQPARLG
jgi:hypothetical protein